MMSRSARVLLIMFRRVIYEADSMASSAHCLPRASAIAFCSPPLIPPAVGLTMMPVKLLSGHVHGLSLPL